MNTKRTPLPWKTGDEPHNSGVIFAGGKRIAQFEDWNHWVDGKPVAVSGFCPSGTTTKSNIEEMLANADFAVRACNSHDELVAACETVIRECDLDAWSHACEVVTAALAKARGE